MKEKNISRNYIVKGGSLTFSGKQVAEILLMLCKPLEEKFEHDTLVTFSKKVARVL